MFELDVISKTPTKGCKLNHTCQDYYNNELALSYYQLDNILDEFFMISRNGPNREHLVIDGLIDIYSNPDYSTSYDCRDYYENTINIIDHMYGTSIKINVNMKIPYKSPKRCKITIINKCYKYKLTKLRKDSVNDYYITKVESNERVRDIVEEYEQWEPFDYKIIKKNILDWLHKIYVLSDGPSSIDTEKKCV